jgi:NADPH-dependent curcumin reductase
MQDSAQRTNRQYRLAARPVGLPKTSDISQYNSTSGVRGPANYMSLLVHRARMEGMVVFDYASRFEEARREMTAGCRRASSSCARTSCAASSTFPTRSCACENTGKQVLQVV